MEARLREALQAYPAGSVAVVDPTPARLQNICQLHARRCATVALDDLSQTDGDSPTQFDMAVAMGALARAGLGTDGPAPDPDADLRWMSALRNILSPGGLLLLSVPVGTDDVLPSRQRSYGKRRGPLLTHGWEVVAAFGYTKRERRLTAARGLLFEPLLVLRNASESEPLLMRLPGSTRPIRIDGGIRSQFVFETRIAPLIDDHCRPGEIVTATLDGMTEPVAIRAGTSDAKCFNEVLLAGDYDFDLPPLEPRLIVDAGANVGYVSRLLAVRYPRAHILALEPEPSNYEMLQRNVAGYAGVVPLRAALWSRKAWLRIVDEETAAWGTRVEAAPGPGPDAIPAVAVPDLLARAQAAEIDILKMDVEGSEREVFTSGAERWLPRVKILLMEIHDDLPGCDEAVRGAMKCHDFQWTSRRGRYGWIHCLVRSDLAALSPRP